MVQLHYSESVMWYIAQTYLPTYQNQNVVHQAKTMCMYTIDEQEISQILGFQKLSSSGVKVFELGTILPNLTKLEGFLHQNH